MKEDLVLAVVSLIIAIVMGVFAVSNFYGGEIIAGVIKTGLVIWYLEVPYVLKVVKV